MPLHIGAAEADRVEEQQLPIPLGMLTDDADFIARRVAPLPSGFHDPVSGTFTFSNHSWIVRVDGLTVLVDPCNGNGRKRGIPFFDDLDLPYLERLAATGNPAESIDMVFCTHLHHDHCGWNTMQVDGRWVPTFPNATYVIVEAEYRRWDPSSPDPHPNTFNPSAFEESVRPVVEAGQAKLISAPHDVSPSMSIEPAVGHTVGHAILGLASDGERAYFTGDVLHHPAQVTRPELHLPGCDDLAAAVATRHALLRRIHEERALLFPAHFPAPHYGRIDIDGDELVFVPGGEAGSLDAEGQRRRAGS